MLMLFNQVSEVSDEVESQEIYLSSEHIVSVYEAFESKLYTRIIYGDHGNIIVRGSLIDIVSQINSISK